METCGKDKLAIPCGKDKLAIPCGKDKLAIPCGKDKLAIPFKRFKDQTPKEQAKTLERLKELLDKLNGNLENSEHQMKVNIWTASLESKILHINMKDGNNYYGTPNFAINETYETDEKLNKMFNFNILVANGIGSNSALGGTSHSIYISEINSISFY
jgi:hypothetical protein